MKDGHGDRDHQGAADETGGSDQRSPKLKPLRWVSDYMDSRKRALWISIVVAAALGTPVGSAAASSGSLDQSFGEGGVVSLGVTKGAAGVVERPDGSLVVGSSWQADSDFLWAHLVRRDGTELPGSPVRVLAGNSNTEDVGVAKDGSFYLAGWASGRPLNPWRDLGPFSPVVGAFDAGRRPIATFGSEGRFAGVWQANFQVEAVRVQPDGKVLLAGARRGKKQALVVKRLTKDGRLDRSFSQDGSVSLPARWRSRDGFVDLELTRGRKILAFGFRGGKIVIARFRANGALDRGFGRRGLAVKKVVMDPDCSIKHGCWDSDMTVGRDGTITVASHVTRGAGRSAYVSSVLHRFSATGKIKQRWRLPKVSGGRVMFADTLLQQPDDKLVVIGPVRIGPFGKPNPTATAVVRLRRDGRLDRSFGRKGIRLVSQIGDPGAGAVTSDGKIVVAGSERLTGPASRMTLVRLES